MYFEGSILWAYAMLYAVAVWIGIFQGATHDGLLDCYTPVKLAYNLLQPVGGADISLAPIIFMHGTAGTKETWYDIPQVIADRSKRTVYNLDARDHGDSEYSTCFNYDINAADVLHFMDEHNIPKAVLIGYSMGGTAFIKVSLWQPERVEMVFIEETYVKRIPTEQLQNISKHIELFQEAAQNVPISYDLESAYEYVNNYLNGSEIPANSVGESARKGSATILINLVRGKDGRYGVKADVKVITDTLKSSETTMSENIGRYEGPAFFIYGTASPFRSDQDEDTIKDRFPNAKLLPVEGANHQLHGYYPKEFIEIVSNNLSS